MRRWIILLVLGHVAGSYGMEACDQITNCDTYAVCGEPPAWEIAAAPVRVVPYMIREAIQEPGSWRSGDMCAFWVAYLIPFGLVVILGMIYADGRRGAEARGFEVVAAKRPERDPP